MKVFESGMSKLGNVWKHYQLILILFQQFISIEMVLWLFHPVMTIYGMFLSYTFDETWLTNYVKFYIAVEYGIQLQDNV